MKSLVMPVVASGFVAAAVVLAPFADAAPSGPSNAAQTVSELQGKGYNVIVEKIGAAPLDQCAVSAVRPGQTYTRMESEIPGPMDQGVVTTVTAKTVYVHLSC
jgi:hypothetical protein